MDKLPLLSPWYSGYGAKNLRLVSDDWPKYDEYG